MRYLITGGKGQLGQEVTNLLSEQNKSFTSYDSKALNIVNNETVNEVFEKEKPTVVFHCAAYTAVDKAEEDTKTNWDVNVEGTRHIVEACKKYGALLVFISTDYVFDGTSKAEYKEMDQPNPQNEYGKAKLAAEQLIEEGLEQYYIIRTSWVFGEFGNNFVYTMKRLAKDKEKLTIVSDQIGRPTWTRTLAEFMLHVTDTLPDYGVYHLSNNGECSWYEFAEVILKNEPIIVEPIPSKDFPQKAKRPMHSVLNLEKTIKTGFKPEHWETALSKLPNRKYIK